MGRISVNCTTLSKIKRGYKKGIAYFAKTISENKIIVHINIYSLTVRKLIFSQYV